MYFLTLVIAAGLVAASTASITDRGRGLFAVFVWGATCTTAWLSLVQVIPLSIVSVVVYFLLFVLQLALLLNVIDADALPFQERWRNRPRPTRRRSRDNVIDILSRRRQRRAS